MRCCLNGKTWLINVEFNGRFLRERSDDDWTGGHNFKNCVIQHIYLNKNETKVDFAYKMLFWNIFMEFFSAFDQFVYFVSFGGVFLVHSIKLVRIETWSCKNNVQNKSKFSTAKRLLSGQKCVCGRGLDCSLCRRNSWMLFLACKVRWLKDDSAHDQCPENVNK